MENIINNILGNIVFELSTDIDGNCVLQCTQERSITKHNGIKKTGIVVNPK